MDLFHSSATNKQQSFNDTTRSLKCDGSVLLTYESKMWLFERKDNILSIRPIHGFVVGIVKYDWNCDGSRGAEYTKYIADIAWRNGYESGGDWTSFHHDKEVTTAYVFWNMKTLNEFIEELEHQFLTLERGKDVKEIFIIPVTVNAGMTS